MNITEMVANFIATVSYDSIPLKVIETAKKCILDWLGVTIAGSREEIADILIKALQVIGGNEQASILGKGIKTSVLNAALINGTTSHVLDFDDTHLPSFTHPTVAIFPAVLAIAEAHNKNGKEVLEAYVAGFEVESRLGMAAGKSHYFAGWHSTATVGRFGAVAGAARLLKLNVEQLVNALGIAGTQVAGVRQVFGTMCKPFHPGKAAMDGILAALLAGEGFISSKNIIEGEKGFLDIYSDHPDESKITDELGKVYQLPDIGFKLYASCRGTHATIDLIKDLRDSINKDEVAGIDIEVPKLSLDAAGIDEPKVGLEGKFSIRHCAALALLKGNVSEGMFTDEQVNDPVLVNLRKKINVKLNNDIGGLGAKVCVCLNDGKVYEKSIPAPKGEPEFPVSFDDLKGKFKELTKDVLSLEKTNALIEMVKDIEKVKDIGELVRLCNP